MKEDLKEFAEQYYWIHMARFHFITIMAQGFYQEMVLPEKFVKCSKEELSENVILKGPSGNLWLVKLLKLQGDLLFKDGWKEFVEAHKVEEGDILSFEYEGYSCFNVLIYDTRDYCERETSYFARNHKNVLADEACPPKKQSVGNSGENMLKPPPADTSEVQSPKVHYDDNPRVEQLSPPGCTASNGKIASNSLRNELGLRRRKVRKIELADLPVGSAEDMHKHLTSDKFGAHTQNLSSLKFPASSRRTGSKSHCFACTGCETNRKGDSTTKGKGGRPRKIAVESSEPKLIQSIRRGKSAYQARIETILKSSRRPVTNEEKERTLQIASEIKPANPFFRIVMRDSHVYRGHFMTIPADFLATHLLKWRRADLRVPDGKDMWHNVRIQPKASSGITGAQWRNFVQDNNLENGDVCVFELCEAEKNLVFDVRIFRVVSEVTPLIKETVTF
ncbi:B3 domain-containing protein-like [Iris pallida]|uniref:B3 domain-containing protein-like n=1 Tax=Iris pallida TaxID=29817 RepID=A0AAX6IER4_IRIPA|nr:B3 domain-containing protein-like [Iris pallida]